MISERTFADLDLEELFMALDRTHSKIGQQFLYMMLRTIPQRENRIPHLERIISFCDGNKSFRSGMVEKLKALNAEGAYFLQHLLHGENLDRPRWYWVVPMLSGMSLATLFLTFFFPVLPLFILIVSVNVVIHYINKGNVLTYSNSVPQLVRLYRVSRFVQEHEEAVEEKTLFDESLEKVGGIVRSSTFLSWESRINNEMGQLADYFLELIKAAFLLEPIMIFRVVEALDAHRSHIKKLFYEVATIDSAISVLSYREELPFHVQPVLDEAETLSATDLFHPLIPAPVSNSIQVKKGKSVLISGSNMSGKTTFIRTIGINMLLAQTINTVCARDFRSSPFRIFSAVRIADDLFEDTSYYFEEVKVIKEMMTESQSGQRNLFLLDELFKGTNTVERVASGKAVLSYLNQRENLVFASTHDLELTDLLGGSYDFYHFEESVENEELIFDYKIKDGKWTHTNAIKILEINGFPKEVTEEATKLAEKMRDKKKKNDKP